MGNLEQCRAYGRGLSLSMGICATLGVTVSGVAFLRGVYSDLEHERRLLEMPEEEENADPRQ